MARVVLDHVVKKFGAVVAVNDLSLEIQDKEFLVLVGPSGCGKSTALRMIAGLEEVTSGNIYIGDRMVNDVSPKDRDIAMVFQSYALYPHMNVYDNMAFGLRMRKVPNGQIEHRVKETASILGIGDLLQRKPKQLSGGQRQRVALGRAIVREPKVFLMDEPLSNLDAKLRVQTRAELIKLHQRISTTVIYVTHDQVEAMTMGSRIAVLKDGVLQQLDTPQTVYAHPSNLFVAGFIGSPAMNLFDVRLRAGDEGVEVIGPAFSYRLPASGAKSLSAYVGRELVLGIRPEQLSHRSESNDDWVEVPSTVDVVESMGSEQYVYYSSGGGSYVARLDPEVRARIGERMGTYFRKRDAHLFDKATTSLLNRNGADS